MTYVESLLESVLKLLVETEDETGLSAEHVLNKLPQTVAIRLSTRQVASLLNNLVAFGFAAKHQATREIRYTATTRGREHFAQLTSDPG